MEFNLVKRKRKDNDRYGNFSEYQNQLKKIKLPAEIKICTWNINHFIGNDEFYKSLDNRLKNSIQSIQSLTDELEKELEKELELQFEPELEKELEFIFSNPTLNDQKLEELLKEVATKIEKKMDSQEKIEKKIELFKQKNKSIENILKNQKVDLLILQEVNSTDIEYFTSFLQQSGITEYACHLGVRLKAGSNHFVTRLTGQIEYYVLFYKTSMVKIQKIEVLENAEDLSKRKIKSTKYDQNNNQYTITIRRLDTTKYTLEDKKEGEAVEWIRHRPVVLRLIEIHGVEIFLGGVHTSPSMAWENAKEYIDGMSYCSQKKPWILVGDWNITTQQVEQSDLDGYYTKKWKRQLNTECDYISKHYNSQLNSQLEVAKPQFPTHQSGATIDYCVVSKDFIIKNVEVLKNDFEGVSDHYPVITTLEIKATSTMQSLSTFTYTMSDEPVLLNGMKVLFDNPTPTTPVTLQPKQRGTNNGR